MTNIRYISNTHSPDMTTSCFLPLGKVTLSSVLSMARKNSADIMKGQRARYFIKGKDATKYPKHGGFERDSG